jgi:hypothetical protein
MPARLASLQYDWKGKRSLLFIHDAQKDLAYTEAFDGECRSVLAMPGTDGKEDLLGCDGKIWRFSN